MNKECPNCHDVDSGKYCPRCGTEKVAQPYCNWCQKTLWPYMKFCRECGKSRDDAINTFPPPKLPGKIKLFFQKIFGNEPTAKETVD